MLAQSNTSRRLRAVLVALFTLASASVSSAAHADFGTVWIWELKGGWFIGGSAGGGTLLFHGRRYPLSIGGLSVGLVFGGSVTRLYVHVGHLWRPSGVTGGLWGAGPGVVVLVGAVGVELR